MSSTNFIFLKKLILTDGENTHAQLWQTRRHPNNVPILSISLHIHKTDSEVKMRVHLSAYSTITSARSIIRKFN